MNNSGRNDNIHGDEEMFTAFGADQIVSPAYCDYLINLVSIMQIEIDSDEIIASTGKIEYDLHPKYGYLQSTKKSIILTDINGKEYRVTVEEV